MEADISTRARTQIEELVPSRYAVKIGDMEIIIISDGVLAPPAESMATNADTKTLNAWLDERLLAHDTFDWALNAVVVKTRDQTILIDSGLGEEYPDFARAGHLIQRLEAAGVDLGSVTDVVLTHMHFDHVGGLLAHGVKQRLRSDLRVHLSTAEAKFWQQPDFSQTAMPPALADLARKASVEFLKEYSSYLHLFDQEAEVADGVTVSLTGGHTPGHSVVRVKSGNDRLMFGGDAIFPSRLTIQNGITASSMIQRRQHECGCALWKNWLLRVPGSSRPTCHFRQWVGWSLRETFFVGSRLNGTIKSGNTTADFC